MANSFGSLQTYSYQFLGTKKYSQIQSDNLADVINLTLTVNSNASVSATNIFITQVSLSIANIGNINVIGLIEIAYLNISVNSATSLSINTINEAFLTNNINSITSLTINAQNEIYLTANINSTTLLNVDSINNLYLNTTINSLNTLNVIGVTELYQNLLINSSALLDVSTINENYLVANIDNKSNTVTFPLRYCDNISYSLLNEYTYEAIQSNIELYAIANAIEIQNTSIVQADSITVLYSDLTITSNTDLKVYAANILYNDILINCETSIDAKAINKLTRRIKNRCSIELNKKYSVKVIVN